MRRRASVPCLLWLLGALGPLSGCSGEGGSTYDPAPYVGSWFTWSPEGTTPYLTFVRVDGGLTVQAVSLRASGQYGQRDTRLGHVISVDPFTVDWGSSDRLIEPSYGGPILWSEIPAAHVDYGGSLSLSGAPDGGRLLTLPSALAEELGLESPARMESSRVALSFPWVRAREVVGVWEWTWEESFSRLSLGLGSEGFPFPPAARFLVEADGGFAYFSIVDGVVSSLQGTVADQDGRWLFSPAERPPVLWFPDGGSVQPRRANLVGNLQRALLRSCSFFLSDGGCPPQLVITGFEWPYLDRE